MNEAEQIQEKASVPSDLDARLARFEQRMADEEERTRPKRTHAEIIDAAIEAVRGQVAAESVKLGGHFRMAAQEQAQRETVADLEWLVRDLEDLRGTLPAE
jgi:uncharacterized protein involved in exopolysaccharide biosynthesis